MEETFRIDQAYELMCQAHILFLREKGKKVYFKKKREKILVYGTNSRYPLSKDDFFLLYKNELFYVLDDSSFGEIDEEKDREYYSWSHK